MDNSLPRSSSGPLSPGSSSGARFGKLRSLDLFPKVVAGARAQGTERSRRRR